MGADADLAASEFLSGPAHRSKTYVATGCADERAPTRGTPTGTGIWPTVAPTVDYICNATARQLNATVELFRDLPAKQHQGRANASDLDMAQQAAHQLELPVLPRRARVCVIGRAR